VYASDTLLAVSDPDWQPLDMNLQVNGENVTVAFIVVRDTLIADRSHPGLM
jgi:hypothetical protein